MLRAAVLAVSKPPMMYPWPLSSADAKFDRGAGIDAATVYSSRMTSYLIILQGNGQQRRRGLQSAQTGRFASST